MRGKAQQWSSDFYQSRSNFTLNDLTSGLLNRFTSQSNSKKLLEQFMARKQARSETDWNKILEEAGQIKTLKLLDTLALMRLVTSRAPETMKSFLLQKISETCSWSNFIKNAQETSWIAFENSKDFLIQDNKRMGIEEMEIDYIRKYAYQQDRNYNQKHEKFSKKKKWCELHKATLIPRMNALC
ncbi:hypothetical protein GVAV_000222 [Gurleya vavrai]